MKVSLEELRVGVGDTSGCMVGEPSAITGPVPLCNSEVQSSGQNKTIQVHVSIMKRHETYVYMYKSY